MKKALLALIGASLCVACEQRVEPAGGGPDKVVEKDTTVVNPPAGGEKKESNTTIVNPPAAEKKTETNTTTTSPGTGTSSTSTTTKEPYSQQVNYKPPSGRIDLPLGGFVVLEQPSVSRSICAA
jgi:hypothetical protein